MLFQIITSRVVSRWMMLPAVLLAVAAGFEIQYRFKAETYNRELTTEYVTDPLGGSVVLDYAFAAPYASLKGLWVFFDIPPGSPQEGRLCLTLRRAGDDHPVWTQSFDCKPTRLGLEAQLCRIEGLSLTKGDRYVLAYALPDMKEGLGWRLRYETTENATASISWGSKRRNLYQPGMLWLAKRPSYPLPHMLVACVLLVICSLGAGKETCYRAPALLVLLTSCLLLGVYHWQSSLWQFWGYFWPDGYPGLSVELTALFKGQIPVKECLASIDRNQNGQAFFVPLVMAVFQVMGLSVKGSYLLSNFLFLTGAGALLLGLLRLKGLKGERESIAMGLLFFSHPCIIGSAGRLQTDMAGVFSTLLFTYALLRAFAADHLRARFGWYVACGMAGCLGCTIRIALAPLLLVPACLFIWSLVFELKRRWPERAAYLIPFLTGCALLWLCWWSFGLWGTLSGAYAFSKEFNHLFSWSGFAINTLEAMPLCILIILLLGRRLFYDREFAAVVGSAVGLLAMLACGHIPTWMRYWSPPAALGIVLCIWAYKEWPAKGRALLGAAWIGTLLNCFIK